MSTFNEIKICLGSESNISTPCKYQYDHGQIVRLSGSIPEGCFAEIANEGDPGTEEVDISDGIIQIPDECFLDGRSIIVYIVTRDASSHVTHYEIHIPIYRRACPE